MPLRVLLFSQACSLGHGQQQATPIQMRVYGLGTSKHLKPIHIIPHCRAKPSVIGFYHGGGKRLDLKFFTQYLLFEFRRLHPGTSIDDDDYLEVPFNNGEKLERRKCSVRVRCGLADTDARHAVQNSKKAGYNSCERCEDCGERSNHSTHIRLLTSDSKLRSERNWHQYLTHRWVVNKYEPTDRPYRHAGFSPFSEEPRIMLPLLDWALDGMHIGGGGVIRRLLECLFRMKRLMRGTYKLYNEAKMSLKVADDYMLEWRKPAEFVREVRPISEVKHWKMREGHEALLYHLVPLLAIPEVRSGVGESSCDAAMCLVIGLQLIYQTTHESPSNKDIDEAEKHLKAFFHKLIDIYGKDVVSYKMHCLVHLANECRIRGSHLGSFDCYPFENWLGDVKGGYVKTGKSVVTQFCNSLKSHAQNALAMEEDDLIYGQCAMGIDAEVDAMLKQGTMNLPATHVHRVDYRAQKIKCSGFMCSTKYPDNVLVIRDEDKTEVGYRGNNLVHLLVVTGIGQDPETKRLQVSGQVFKNPRTGHSCYKNKLLRPHLNLRLLGIHEAKKTELSGWSTFDFLDMVIGKAYPYHMILTRGKSDANPVGNCLNSQWWTFIRLMHTRSPKTLV